MSAFKDFFKEITGHEPYEHQKKMADELWKDGGNQPVLLKAPTGSGKTEAVVLPFLYQWKMNRWPIAPRLIYVLPMRALANQISDRINGYAAKVNDKIRVSVQHGERHDDAMLFSDIVVTTLDQVIYAYARSTTIGKHAEVPAGDLANSLLVFDEAHMYSPYTYGMIHTFLEILISSRIPFVFMTATLPTSLQKDFQQGVLGNGFEFSLPEVQPPAIKRKITLKETKPEPLLSKDMKLHPEALNLIDNKKALVVLNQVGRAQEVYRQIRDKLGDKVLLIHGRFTREDRENLEKRVKEMLGKNGSGGIVVATQVVEVGLDISADVLLTELAPADSIVQRAGRIARWGGEGEVYVFGVKEEMESEDYWKSDEVEKDALPYNSDHTKETAKALQEALQNGPSDLLTSWESVQDFTDNLEYHVEHSDCASAAWHLLEDSILLSTERPRPQDVAVREGKPVTVEVYRETETPQVEDGKRALSLPSVNMTVRLIKAAAAAGVSEFHRVKYEWDKEKKTMSRNKEKVKIKNGKPEKGWIYPFDHLAIKVPDSIYTETLGLVLSKEVKDESAE